MDQPELLKKNEPLLWSVGIGTDVWELFCAAQSGDLSEVKRLLEKDPALVRSSYDYRTALYFAVRENQIDVARLLIERGADPINSGTPDTLLEIACDRVHTELQSLLKGVIAGRDGGSPDGNEIAAAIRDRNHARVRQLLDASPAVVHSRDERTNQPIHWAVMTRQVELIDELLPRGADIDARRADGARPIQLTNGDYHYRGWRDVPADTAATADDVYRHLIAKGAYIDIGMASAKGDLKRVQELLNEDPTLANRVAEYGSYYIGCGAPLKNAAATGQIEIVRLLLKHGADPNLPEEGIAPRGHALYSAAANRHHEIARLLLEHGSDPNAPVESSADGLSRAISNGDEAMIELLCSYAASRPVHLLAYYGDVRTAAAVFAANPELANDPEALENAAIEGQEAFVRLMLRYRPDLASRIAVGVRSRGPDSSIKTRELTEFLFHRGMNPNLANWLGITPLHRFAERGDVENATSFLEHGAHLNARDEECRSTPLGYAAKFGRKNMVELLLSRGARTNLPDDPPWATPLAWASRRGHHEIAELLKRHSAT
jgi:ankyrin repeat protein